MPAANFRDYTRQLSNAILDIVGAGQARIIDWQIDQRSPERGYLTGILIFADRSELHFREFVDTTRSVARMMYAYHYQDAQKTLIFRYDNALHRPTLPQQEHKHTPSGIEAGAMPTLIEVIDELVSLLG